MNKFFKLIILINCSLFFPVNSFADLQSGLVGWWKFDEASGTTFADSSSGGRVGTGSNTSNVQNCKKGNCVSFNSNSIVTTSSLASIGDFSMAVWVYLRGDGSSQYSNLILVNGAPFRQLYILNTSYLLRFYTDDVGSLNSGVAIPLNAWTHAAVTLNGTTLKMYVNGIEVYSNTHTINNATGPLNIGGFSSVGNSNENLDDVRIYNRALTAIEVADLNRSGAVIYNAVISNGKINQ